MSPAFLERRGYRRRRLTEAAVLLPLLGAGLFVVPLMWRETPDVPASASTADVMLYVFRVWAVLVGLSAVIARALGRDDAVNPPATGDAPPTSHPNRAADG